MLNIRSIMPCTNCRLLDFYIYRDLQTNDISVDCQNCGDSAIISQNQVQQGGTVAPIPSGHAQQPDPSMS